RLALALHTTVTLDSAEAAKSGLPVTPRVCLGLTDVYSGRGDLDEQRRRFGRSPEESGNREGGGRSREGPRGGRQGGFRGAEIAAGGCRSRCCCGTSCTGRGVGEDGCRGGEDRGGRTAGAALRTDPGSEHGQTEHAGGQGRRATPLEHLPARA